MSKSIHELLRVEPARADQEIFRVGPEKISEYVGRMLLLMGAAPNDIIRIEVDADSKKNPTITARVSLDSDIFYEHTNTQLSILSVQKGLVLNSHAVEALRNLGYAHYDHKDRELLMVELTEQKKYVEIQFNTEVTMAIVTDTDFTDVYLHISAIEEVLKKKDKRKKNGKKWEKKGDNTIVIVQVQRSKGASGFSPSQVIEWGRDEDEDEEDED